MKTIQLNKRAQKAMINRNKGEAGLCYHADPERQVMHVAVHDGMGHGLSMTMEADQVREMIVKLLRVEITSIADLQAATARILKGGVK